MLSREERDLILETTRADPEFMLGLLEQALYSADVDVTDVREARLIIEELSRLCATTMAPGVAARVARFLKEDEK